MLLQILIATFAGSPEKALFLDGNYIISTVELPLEESFHLTTEALADTLGLAATTHTDTSGQDPDNWAALYLDIGQIHHDREAHRNAVRKKSVALGYANYESQVEDSMIRDDGRVHFRKGACYNTEVPLSDFKRT